MPSSEILHCVQDDISSPNLLRSYIFRLAKVEWNQDKSLKLMPYAGMITLLNLVPDFKEECLEMTFLIKNNLVAIAIRSLLRSRREFSSSKVGRIVPTKSLEPSMIQALTGPVSLFTGNFRFFTKYEAGAIESALDEGRVLVLLYDRDSIVVPANERAMWIRSHLRHHPNLEVRVAYGAPVDKPGSETQFIDYIKKQIPEGMRVSSIRCGHRYSALLAQKFEIPLIENSLLQDIDVLENKIQTNLNEHMHLLFPVVQKRVISPFKEMIDEQSFKELVEVEKQRVASDIQRLNLNHPNAYSFFKRTRWNLDNLNAVNLPVVIGRLADEEARNSFSQPMNTQVFDMPVYMPGQGWRIPGELVPYQSVLAKIVAAESLANEAMAQCNAYVTVDAGLVYPKAYARRGGLHVDGFLTQANIHARRGEVLWGDNTYLVSDNPELQTECYPGPFDLTGINTDDASAVLKALDDQGRNMPYVQYKPYDIIKLTTNNVHAVHPNMTQSVLNRCFVKVTFSERLFNRTGNTVNPLLNYRLLYVPRGEGRSTQNFIGVAPTGFEDVNLKEIDCADNQLPQWVVPKPMYVCKNPNTRIMATAAKEGEVLETSINGLTVTSNTARAGDMKISRTEGDRYFLGYKFKLLYKPAPSEGEHIYAPIGRRLRALQVSSNITFPASWGTRQTIPAGGYILDDGQGDTWGVHPESFKATYEQCRLL